MESIYNLDVNVASGNSEGITNRKRPIFRLDVGLI